MRKNIAFLQVFLAAIIIFAGCTSKAVTTPEQSHGVTLLCHNSGGTGKTLSALKVNVTYFDPFFYTDAGYPGFYIGVPMTCKLTITNTSRKWLKCLTVEATHEYYDTGVCDRWWDPNPREVNYTKGEAMPGDSSSQWSMDIAPGAQTSMTWTYTAPLSTCSGLDQTHVIITKSCGDSPEQVMLDSPEAGIFCPPPPAKN
jgi:hypothetical protein